MKKPISFILMILLSIFDLFTLKRSPSFSDLNKAQFLEKKIEEPYSKEPGEKKANKIIINSNSEESSRLNRDILSIRYKTKVIKDYNSLKKILFSIHNFIEGIEKQIAEKRKLLTIVQSRRRILSQKSFVLKGLKKEQEKAEFLKKNNILEKKLGGQLKQLNKILADRKKASYDFLKNIIKLGTKGLINELAKGKLDYRKFNSIDDGSFSYIEKQVINDDEKVFIIGDLHGNFEAFDSIFSSFIDRGIVGQNLKINHKNDSKKRILKKYKFVFLGDIIDRGLNSFETLLILVIFKFLNPNDVVFLRGNHESYSIFSCNGFEDELINKFGICEFTNYIIGGVTRYFNFLPAALFLKTPKNIFLFNHAGWSSKLLNKDLKRFLFSKNMLKEKFFTINSEFLKELTWFDIDFKGYLKQIKPSSRGSGILIYPKDIVFSEMQKLKNFNRNIRKKHIIMFGGHMHSVAKGELPIIKNKVDELLDQSIYEKPTPGFIKTEGLSDKIYLIISGAINVYDELGQVILNRSINYYPSYLALNIYDKKFYNLKGYYKNDLTNSFKKIDIPDY